MRGKAKPESGSRHGVGITPAYAGKRPAGWGWRPWPRDHPRVCGEKFYVDEVLPGDTGSPPRMRGKVQRSSCGAESQRITPAYAGKSASAARQTLRQWDHPRVCGEKPICTPDAALILGSPPRMRGKEKGISFPASNVGITPAYAGKSERTAIPSIRHEDHPRVCGEK